MADGFGLEEMPDRRIVDLSQAVMCAPYSGDCPWKCPTTCMEPAYISTVRALSTAVLT